MNSAVVSEVRSVLIPLADRQLLLPNAVVAEVLGYQPPEKVDGKPDWYLGNMAWRGVLIPVISFESMLGGADVTPGHRGRIAIMNALNGNNRLTHFGVVVQAIPSLVRVTTDNVLPKPDTSAEESVFIKQVVELDLSTAYIPDLDEIERQLVEVL
ncbi:MAG: chemotaxis protein CheW [Candidatus Thiodiazotropha sp. (ex Monitilora ramsayi)]|nr:chemotaxis protein CheW [Candidatus Thiodiazotropha sp. (ex Monitilora ramsayi)]